MIVETEFDLLLRLVRDYFNRGYCQYQVVKFPENKDSEKIKQRLETEFEFTNCRTVRYRRRKRGFANVVILYFNYKFYILATEGKNEKLESEKFLDIRETPLNINKYQIKASPYKKSYKCTVYLDAGFKGNLKKTLKRISLHKKDKVIKRFKLIIPYTFDGINQGCIPVKHKYKY
jgi:hypothetical protein